MSLLVILNLKLYCIFKDIKNINIICHFVTFLVLLCLSVIVSCGQRHYVFGLFVGYILLNMISQECLEEFSSFGTDIHLDLRMNSQNLFLV